MGRRTYIGMNESHFLFVLDVMVLNLLDEGRMTYSLRKIFVLSLIILLDLCSTCFSYKALRVDSLKQVILLSTNVYNALQIILVL